MQATEVIKRITSMYPKMSQSQKRVADVILQDPEGVAFFNVAQLANASKVSDSTVTRFATFVGYTGFPALSQQLQAIVRMRLTTRERLDRSQKMPREDPEAVYYHAMVDDMENIKLMVDQLDAPTLQRAIDLLDRAEKIGIVCSRSVVSLGLFFEFYLNLLSKPSIILTGEPRTIDYAHRLTPADVVVGIGFSRYTRFTVNSLKYCQQVGIPTIAITDYPSSPLILHAQVSLLCPTGIASHMDSLVAPLSLIQAVLRSLSNKHSTVLMQNVKNLEDIWQQFNIYIGSEDDLS